MTTINNTNSKRLARKRRVRLQTKGDDSRPRLHVYRSNHYIYAQIINDETGKTLVAASEKSLTKSTGTKSQKAEAVGEALAKAATKKKITTVRFDRGYYKYHGRVKALANSARKHGLEF